jgi:hypothetical protein
MNILTVSTEAEASQLDLAELGEFLFLFRGVVVGLDRIVPPTAHSETRTPTEAELSAFLHALEQLDPRQLDALFEGDARGNVVRIDHISHHSPWEIAFCGCAFLLVAGIIFSGGRVSISMTGLRATLPSLGEGIKSLKQALGLGKMLDAGFGIRPRIIKLNKQEFAALMQQDPNSRDKGGFQHFLVGLQSRINKQTRELELSQNDLERIYRYKANPQKGGWQSRFKKIFGRHFPTKGAAQSKLLA